MPMMHNLLVIEPGSRVDIVTKAATMGAAGINSFVPESDKVLAATPLVLTGNTYKLYFKGPNQAGQVRVRLHLPARLLHVGHSGG